MALKSQTEDVPARNGAGDVAFDLVDDVPKHLDVVSLQLLDRRPVEDDRVAGDWGNARASASSSSARAVPGLD